MNYKTSGHVAETIVANVVREKKELWMKKQGLTEQVLASKYERTRLLSQRGSLLLTPHGSRRIYTFALRIC